MQRCISMNQPTKMRPPSSIITVPQDVLCSSPSVHEHSGLPRKPETIDTFNSTSSAAITTSCCTGSSSTSTTSPRKQGGLELHHRKGSQQRLRSFHALERSSKHSQHQRTRPTSRLQGLNDASIRPSRQGSTNSNGYGTAGSSSCNSNASFSSSFASLSSNGSFQGSGVGLGFSSPQPGADSSSLYYNTSSSRLPSVSSMRRIHSRTSSSGTMTSHNSSSSLNWCGSAVIQVAQRSNGAKVKAVIAELTKACAQAATTAQQQPQQEEESNNSTNSGGDVVHVPLEECGMLSLWSVDAYYKVLISKYGGISAIVTAMNVFSSNDEIQAYGCQTLKNMNNKLAVQTAGGVIALRNAMMNHPQSIHVQSEACEALRSQTESLLQQEPMDVLQSLVPLLEHAKEMYLTQKGKTSVLFLMDFVTKITTVATATTETAAATTETATATTETATDTSATTTTTIGC